MKFLNKKILLNLTMGEALLWILFYLLQASGLGILNAISSNNTIPYAHLILMTLFKLVLNIIFFLPLWWLFFYRLKHLSLNSKIRLHLLIAPVFTIVWTYIFGVFMMVTQTFGHYPFVAHLWDGYQTLIHYILVFAIFHAYNFWKDTKERLIKENELKAAAYQSEIKALKSQIEPHFLFNTLNSISASVPPQLENTRVLIAQLADTFRYALNVSEKDWVTLDEEVQFIRTWMALEQQRLNKRLQIHYSIEDDVLHTHVPPMILQPLIENAIKHGIDSKIEGGLVTIICRKENDFVKLSVSDTGVGYKGDLNELFSKGIGLKNISVRLYRLFNQTLNINRTEQGLTFSFLVPIHDLKYKV